MTAGPAPIGNSVPLASVTTLDARTSAHLALDDPPSADERKIFVLDTSVILHDHRAIDAFEEHDVAIPMTVLEELDKFKKGSSVLNRNAREFIRRLDAYSGDRILREWIPLRDHDRLDEPIVATSGQHGATEGAEPSALAAEAGAAEAGVPQSGLAEAGQADAGLGETGANPAESERSGRVRVVMPPSGDRQIDLAGLPASENDHLILASALDLARQMVDRRVILVSKDINLRLKARALEIPAEDYKRVQIRSIDPLYRGKTVLALDRPELIDRLHAEGSLAVSEVLDHTPDPHHFFVLTSERGSALAWYDPRTRRLERLLEETAYGVKPRNAEQTFALHAILEPEVPLVTLTGAAGTGKTLIALAGALETSRSYRKILLARPVVPLSNKDLGYLPGDIKSKIDPYMQPLWDNLSFIKSQFSGTDREYRRIDDMVEREKLQIVPLAYLRGRSLAKVLFIVDEAQNLTPHEVKTIITRAGEGTKIVFTGDVFQIDTPYLDTQSNGLSFLIDRMKGQPLFAHVNLEKGERSVLANLASRLL